MKASVKIGDFAGVVNVGGGEATVQSNDFSKCDFGVTLTDFHSSFFRGKGVKKISLYPETGELRLWLVMESGEEIILRRNAYDEEGVLTITKFTREKDSFGERFIDDKYLTKGMEWKDQPPSGPLPEDALRIDLFGFTGKIKTKKK